MTNKVLLKRTSAASLEQLATDVSSSVTVDSYKILESQNTIIFDGDDQDRLFTEISALDLGKVIKDHCNFEFHATRSTYVPGATSGSRYWHLDAISRLDYDDASGSANGSFSTKNDGGEVDIYIMDSGIQGASRPTGAGAALHPEFFHPDFITDLNGSTEQSNYRVYTLPTSLYDPGTTDGNDPQSTGTNSQDGHGTYAAIMAAGRFAGVASKAKIYSLRVSNDAGQIPLSKMLEAYNAIYKHNDPDDAAFKGNTLADGAGNANQRPRSSVVNVSIGSTTPHPLDPYIDRNENYTVQTRNFTVGNSGSSGYTISGVDATTTHTNINNATLTVTKGDILVMNMSASGHPFLVNDANGSFGGATTTSGDNETGEVTIDTSHWSVGNSTTLTYVCQYHGGMTGTINVQAANLASNSNVGEIYDDAEARVAQLSTVTLCRSAGNGMSFEDSSDVQRNYGPQNTKITYGARGAGMQSTLDPEISTLNLSNNTFGPNTDILTVGATRIVSNRQTFATFTNYGEAVTCYAPGQGIYCPSYDWNSSTTTGTNYVGGTHVSISGTSFSSPLVAGMVAVWRDIYDRQNVFATSNVSGAAQSRLSFVDHAAQDPTQVGFQNVTRRSIGAADSYYLTTLLGSDTTDPLYPIRTTAGSNAVELHVGNNTYTSWNPQIGDIYEFEFPRIEDPGTLNSTTKLNDERHKDTFNLGDVEIYNVTAAGGIYYFDQVVNGVASGSPVAQSVLALEQGKVYRFNQHDASNATHPIDISPNPDGTHALNGQSFDDYFTSLNVNSKLCQRYFLAGIGEISRTDYNSAVGGGGGGGTSTSQTITGTTLTSTSDDGLSLTTGTNADISMIGNHTFGTTYANAENKNPSVTWDFNTSSLPAGVTVASYSVLLEDLTANFGPGGAPLVHWSVSGIPNTVSTIAADASAITGATINQNFNAAAVNTNGVSAVGYSGPQPPAGDNHVYRLSVTAQLSGSSTGTLTQSIEFNFDDANTLTAGGGTTVAADNLTFTYTTGGGGGGVMNSIYMEFIDPRGNTHPDFDSGTNHFRQVTATNYYYYCTNHSGMGAELQSVATLTEASVGGISLPDFCSKWRTVSAIDSTNKIITFNADTTASRTEMGGGSMFNYADGTLNGFGDVTDGRPRWPIRATKITGTFFENDAIYEWITNNSSVVKTGNSPAGSAFVAGDIWAQLESEEAGNGGRLVQNFPVPKSRLTTQSINGVDGGVSQFSTRYGSAISNGDTWEARQYTPLPANTGSLTYDGGQGIFFPFVDLTATLTTPALDGSTLANNDTVSETITVASTVTFSGEDVSAFLTSEFELVNTGSNSAFQDTGANTFSITGSGLSFNGSTGLISGNSTSNNSSTTYTIRIREKVSQSILDVTWTAGATNTETITINTQPSNASGDGSFPVDGGTATFTVAASLSGAFPNLNYQWQYAVSQTDVDNGSWTSIPFTGDFLGASGVNTSTLTVPDNTALNGYKFSCVVSSAAANADSVRTSPRDFLSVPSSTTAVWWSGSTSQFATGQTNGPIVEYIAGFSDGAVPVVTLVYASALTGNETNIVNTTYEFITTGAAGPNGGDEFNVRLGKSTIGTVSQSDSGQTYRVQFSHPNGLVAPVINPTTSSAITINDAYSVGTDLTAAGSVNQDVAYTLAATFINAGTNAFVGAGTIVWQYNAGSGFTTVLGTEPWYDSGIGTGTLVFTPTLSLNGYVFRAYAYNDFLGGASGTSDSQSLSAYSAISTSEHTLTVNQTASGPAIKIIRPAGVTADNSLSITSGSLSTSEHLFTIVSDMLPDPATYGPFPNTANVFRPSAQNLNHVIQFRGGTNSPSLTPWNTGALGIAANGTPLYNPSAGDAQALPGSVNAPPAGFQYNTVHNASYYGADTAGGWPEVTGEYHYNSGRFLFSGDWNALVDSNSYYKDTNFSNDHFRHTNGHSKIIGWAFDGHPIYGPYGYTNPSDNTSAPTTMTSSFALIATDTHRPVGSKYTDTITIDSQSVTLSAGTFLQDYAFTPGSGSLDSSNGRYAITPEYPNGTYAYYLSVDNSQVPVYPYIFGTSLRQAYFQPGSGFVPSDPGGTNTNGPTNGGFNPNSIWIEGMTVVANTGGDNGREITVDNITPGTGVHTYQWQKSSDSGVNWADIAASNIAFSGETNTTLTIKDNSTVIDDLLVRLKLTDSTSTVSYSGHMPLQYVGSTLSIQSQPVDQSLISGQTVVLQTFAQSTDDVDLTYQWQESSDNGVSWSSLVGETNSQITLEGIQTPASFDQYQYRVLVSSTSGINSPLASSAATLTITQGAISVATQPTNQTVDETTDAIFDTFITNNSGAVTNYLWEKSDDSGTTWTTVTGETQSTLVVSSTTYADDHDDYYRVTGSVPGLGSITSNVVILTVQRTLAISTQPTNSTYYETQNATFNVVAVVSSGTETYQWQESTDSGTTWSPISGAVNASYTKNSLLVADNGKQYRVIVSLTGSVADITSNVATLTVNVRPTLSIDTQPQNQTVYQPDTASFTVTASSSDSSAFTYQWEKSDDNGTTWNLLTGETTNSYTTPATATANDNDDQYRVVITHPAATNSPITSSVATLTVITPVISYTLQPQSVSTTAGVPVTFNATVSVTSGRTIDYVWQVSSDQGSNWSDIAGSNSNDFSVTGDSTNNGYYYRLKSTSVGAPTAYSNSAVLTLQFISNPSIATTGFVDNLTSKTTVRQPTISSSLFISYLGNGHTSSFWRITRTSDNNIVYTTAADFNANGDDAQKIEFLTPVLDWDTSYTVEVKYRDSAGYDSAWSTPVTFATPSADQPTFVLPIETSLRPTINLNTVIYDTGNFNHTSTDWQIADDATFTTIIYESLTDTTNLTSLEVPSNVVLDSSSNYYVRARINVT